MLGIGAERAAVFGKCRRIKHDKIKSVRRHICQKSEGILGMRVMTAVTGKIQFYIGICQCDSLGRTVDRNKAAAPPRIA